MGKLVYQAKDVELPSIGNMLPLLFPPSLTVEVQKNQNFYTYQWDIPSPSRLKCLFKFGWHSRVATIQTL